MSTPAPSQNNHIVRGMMMGGVALLMWGTLGILTVWTDPIEPFQLVAMAFFVAFAMALLKWIIFRENPRTYLAQPVAAWALGVGGLFGYHFLYFLALRNAPALEANLINYLWPLLIVLFSALLPGERLRWWHVAGTLAGLMGTVTLMVGGGAQEMGSGALLGYAAAVGCGLVWSSYSVANRRLPHVPTDAVGGFCLLGALLATACHLAFETTVWPQGMQWLAVLAMGLGPAGGAFFFWDYGVKFGDIRILGAASYGVPLFSTALLLAIGEGEADWRIVVALVLIVGGALLASKEMLSRSLTRPKKHD